MTPRVLMVTGAYPPEPSGGGHACRALLQALGGAIKPIVLTTSTDPALPPRQIVDDVLVHRVLIRSGPARLLDAVQLTRTARELIRDADLVHLHGFSSKAIALRALTRAAGVPMVLTLHTAGHDEPETVRRRGRLAWRAYGAMDRYVAVSPRLAARGREWLPADRLVEIPNGIDLARFAPVDPEQRRLLRRALELPKDALLVLFVGYFSQDKGPQRIFQAWRTIAEAFPRCHILFVGATRPGHGEIDPSLAPSIRDASALLGLSERVHLIERSARIEAYYQTADLFAFPSVREAMPMALLEAMAAGLACVAIRLPQATDALIDHGVSGWLTDTHPDNLVDALRTLLPDAQRRAAMGRAARQTAARYDIAHAARAHLALYDALLSRRGGSTTPPVRAEVRIA